MKQVSLWVLAGIFLYCARALASAGQPPAPSSFLDRHWMECIITCILCTIVLFCLENDQYGAAFFYVVVAIGYLVYVYVQ